MEIEEWICSHSETLLWQTTFHWEHFKRKHQVLYCFKSVFHFETGYCTTKPGLHPHRQPICPKLHCKALVDLRCRPVAPLLSNTICFPEAWWLVTRICCREDLRHEQALNSVCTKNKQICMLQNWEIKKQLTVFSSQLIELCLFWLFLGLGLGSSSYPRL